MSKIASGSIIAGIIIVLIVLFLGGKKDSEQSQQEIALPEAVEQIPKQETQTQNETPKKSALKTFKVNTMTIQVQKEGEGAAIENGKTAVVHYTGKLTDGTVFDSSIPRGTPFEFPLGAGMVIEGWEKGVLGMKVGEVRTLTIPPEMGYGARGAGALIPPNATLVFEVELLAIK